MHHNTIVKQCFLTAFKNDLYCKVAHVVLIDVTHFLKPVLTTFPLRDDWHKAAVGSDVAFLLDYE